MSRCFALALSLSILLIACGPSPNEALPGETEPAFTGWIELDPAGRILDSGSRVFAGPDRSARASNADDPTDATAPAEGPSLQPALLDRLATAAAGDRLEVVISVATAHRLSRLPAFERSLGRDDPLNLDIAAQREAVQANDDSLRAPERALVGEDVRGRGGLVLEEFRLGNALAVELAAGELREMLDARDDITAVSLLWGSTPPAALQVDDARAMMASNPYVNAGYDGAGYRVGLVDTGVLASHYTLSQPDQVNLYRDCANTPYHTCTYYGYPYYYNASDTRSGGGHGTRRVGRASRHLWRGIRARQPTGHRPGERERFAADCHGAPGWRRLR